MNYAEWEAGIPDVIRNDVLWKMKVYRFPLFLSDVCWNDVSKLAKDSRTKSLSNQLYRAIGSIAANLEEGYSKLSAKDRARFYEYALGSARESRGWYYRGRHLLGESVFDHRAALLTEIIKMLLKIVPDERGTRICEESPEYKVENIWNKDVLF
ncbi:MAG: four helix bundle protein [Verrucomicrobia bacterium]|nr:four helix bundle protein [Verrucomicrobiota bacterium]